MTADSITMRRTGQPPLTFQGELIAEADGHSHTGPGQNRWHELALYRTAGGAYVVQVAWRSRYEHESDDDQARLCPDARAVADLLRSYDPTQFVQGFPSGERNTERQRRLLLDIRARFGALISEVLSGAEFAESAE
jgi:hypothetical protein